MAFVVLKAAVGRVQSVQRAKGAQGLLYRRGVGAVPLQGLITV